MRPLKVKEHFPKAPKIKGQMLLNARVTFTEGVYNRMGGTVVEADDSRVCVLLDLESQETIVDWPR